MATIYSYMKNTIHSQLVFSSSFGGLASASISWFAWEVCGRCEHISDERKEIGVQFLIERHHKQKKFASFGPNLHIVFHLFGCITTPLVAATFLFSHFAEPMERRHRPHGNWRRVCGDVTPFAFS